MGPLFIAGLGVGYYLLIFGISRYAARGSGDREYLKTTAPAWLATLGIVGDSISGVTYLSVPGSVAAKSFSYLAICLGNAVGYLIIAAFFLPLYHQKNLVSLYQWVGSILGVEAQRICSGLFVVSRLFGSAARLCLTAGILHVLVFRELAVSVEFTIIAVALGISLYTLRSGIKSLIVTDLIQSAFLVAGVLAAIAALGLFLRERGVPLVPVRPILVADGWAGFWRSFFSGILIMLAMSGIDQNIMQKTFSVKSLAPLRWSFARLSVIVLSVNFLVLVLGSLLTDAVPLVPGLAASAGDLRLIGFVMEQGVGVLTVLFFLGLAAATLNSADSVITTVVTSIKVDLFPEGTWRLGWIHGIVTAILAIIAILISRFSGLSAIELVLKSAGWTYGPLLGIFVIAAFRLRANRVSLVAALLTAWAVAIAWQFWSPLGVEVIAVLTVTLVFANYVYSRIVRT